MTNNMIIFNAQQELLEAGSIKPTGRLIKVTDAEGNEVTFPEAEAIHTFAAWKELGYAVKKGEKAITKLTIWKHTAKINKETGEEDAKMFMKKAAFFAASQVEKIA